MHTSAVGMCVCVCVCVCVRVRVCVHSVTSRIGLIYGPLTRKMMSVFLKEGRSWRKVHRKGGSGKRQEREYEGEKRTAMKIVKEGERRGGR